MQTEFLSSEPFAKCFLENESKDLCLRYGLSMKAEAPYFPIVFSEKSMLPAVMCRVPGAFIQHRWYGFIDFEQAAFEEKLQSHPQWRDDLFEMKERMMPYCTFPRFLQERSFEYVRFSDAIACWAGSWIGHSNPDYGILLRIGTDGLRERIEENRKKNPEKDDFYTGCAMSLDAFEIICENIRKTCIENAIKETDMAKKAEFEKMAKVFETAPQKPCTDFYSAVVVFSAEFTVLNADSPGNFDQYMFNFFQKSEKEECRCLIRRLLEGFHEMRSWNLCLSGSDENWADRTNDLTYLFLEEFTKTGYHTPNLTMRVHRNTPQKLWDMAVTSIATGTGMPALYNDEVVCPALEKIGIPPEDSHRYCMNGCNQIDILSKSHMGLEDGEVNLGKVLELMLHGGFDMLGDEPRKVMMPLGDVFACRSFDEFLELYYQYQDYVSDVTTDQANTAAKVYAEILCNPIRNCLFEGCLEKGLDFKNGGPTYGHGQILLEGIADTADSLYAIKKLIFDKKKYTLHQLISALEVDFKGYDDLWHDFKFCDKFGNDNEEVDKVCADMVNHFNARLQTKKCFRGGVFTGGCSTFNRSADRGSHTAALPNGKKKKEPLFADSIAATPGNDKNGPTASLLSCLHYDHRLCGSGFVTQMKFSKDLFNTEKGKQAFQNLAKTYFAQGGQQLSINVLDRQALLNAQKEPEKYADLVVRVGGFSALFCELEEGLQQNIIERTEFAV